jgi:hypothetical protein
VPKFKLEADFEKMGKTDKWRRTNLPNAHLTLFLVLICVN